MSDHHHLLRGKFWSVYFVVILSPNAISSFLSNFIKRYVVFIIKARICIIFAVEKCWLFHTSNFILIGDENGQCFPEESNPAQYYIGGNLGIIICIFWYDCLLCGKFSLQKERERDSITFNYQTVGLDERLCCLPLTISASTFLLVSHVVTVCRSENSTKAMANYFIWCFWCGVFEVLENGF